MTDVLIQALRSAEERLTKAWDRLGTPAATRASQWHHLTANQITPIITNLVGLYEAEEAHKLKENERLLKDTITLSQRLGESITDGTISQAIASSPNNNNNNNTSAALSASGDCPLSPTIAGPASHSLVDSIDTKAASNRLVELSENLQAAAETLKKEFTRLDQIADSRIDLLVTLHKQRAILQLPFTKQCKLREAYAKKMFETNADLDGTEIDFDTMLENSRSESLMLFSPLGNKAMRREGLNTSATSPSEQCLQEQRPTVFATSVSEVTRLGRRQDLSITRVEEEAASILLELEASNKSMRESLNAENALIGQLWLKLGSSNNEKLQYHEHIESLEKQIASGGGGHATYDDSVLLHLLPASIQKILLFKSIAPLLEFATNLRGHLQMDYFDQFVEQLGQLSNLIQGRYRQFYTLTKDDSYAVPPDYTVWLDEALASSHAAPAAASRFAPGTPRPASASTAFLNFSNVDFSTIESKIAVVNVAITRAEKELGSLDDRIRLLETVTPLIARRDEILARKHLCEDGGKDRLLSKKANVAKQLLAEENARKEYARELPKVNAEINKVCREWEDIVGKVLVVDGKSVSNTLPPTSGHSSQKNSNEHKNATSCAPGSNANARGASFDHPQTPPVYSPVPARALQAHSVNATPVASMTPVRLSKKRRLDNINFMNSTGTGGMRINSASPPPTPRAGTPHAAPSLHRSQH